MRINVYAEELPEEDDVAIERVETTASIGRKFFGARLYLKSPQELHHTEDDDDRSAITIWGPREKVAGILRDLADEMDDGVGKEYVPIELREVGDEG